MDFKSFEKKVAAADNDSLLRSLTDYAKKMDSDLASYEAVKILKTELLKRLEGEVTEEKVWREGLTDEEFSKVMELYEQGFSISEIQRELADENLVQKPIRLAVAERYGERKECTFCNERTLHVAFKKHDKLSCIGCGKTEL